jgi:hypothetical protein
MLFEFRVGIITPMEWIVYFWQLTFFAESLNAVREEIDKHKPSNWG